jgi:hypothetical protein
VVLPKLVSGGSAFGASFERALVLAELSALMESAPF